MIPPICNGKPKQQPKKVLNGKEATGNERIAKSYAE
jgi:hypothetical protein